jgi:hypothetical protein
MSKLKTWYNPEDPQELLSAEWHANSGEDIWVLLLRTLGALYSRQSAFEAMSGRLNVAASRDGTEVTALWSVTVTPAGLADLRQRIDQERFVGMDWDVTEVVLRTQPDLLLPEEVTSVEVADYLTDEDRQHGTLLALVPADARDGVPDGYRCWKVLGDPYPTVSEEHAPVCLIFTCATDETPPRLSMGVSTELELWSPRTFDGQAVVPGARQNLAWLRRAVEIVADASRGRVSRSYELQAELGAPSSPKRP